MMNARINSNNEVILDTIHSSVQAGVLENIHVWRMSGGTLRLVQVCSCFHHFERKNTFFYEMSKDFSCQVPFAYQNTSHHHDHHQADWTYHQYISCTCTFLWSFVHYFLLAHWPWEQAHSVYNCKKKIEFSLALYLATIIMVSVALPHSRWSATSSPLHSWWKFTCRRHAQLLLWATSLCWRHSKLLGTV